MSVINETRSNNLFEYWNPEEHDAIQGQVNTLFQRIEAKELRSIHGWLRTTEPAKIQKEASFLIFLQEMRASNSLKAFQEISSEISYRAASRVSPELYRATKISSEIEVEFLETLYDYSYIPSPNTSRLQQIFTQNVSPVSLVPFLKRSIHFAELAQYKFDLYEFEPAVEEVESEPESPPEEETEEVEVYEPNFDDVHEYWESENEISENENEDGEINETAYESALFRLEEMMNDGRDFLLFEDFRNRGVFASPILKKLSPQFFNRLLFGAASANWSKSVRQLLQWQRTGREFRGTLCQILPFLAANGDLKNINEMLAEPFLPILMKDEGAVARAMHEAVRTNHFSVFKRLYQLDIQFDPQFYQNLYCINFNSEFREFIGWILKDMAPEPVEEVIPVEEAPQVELGLPIEELEDQVKEALKKDKLSFIEGEKLSILIESDRFLELSKELVSKLLDHSVEKQWDRIVLKLLSVMELSDTDLRWLFLDLAYKGSPILEIFLESPLSDRISPYPGLIFQGITDAIRGNNVEGVDLLAGFYYEVMDDDEGALRDLAKNTANPEIRTALFYHVMQRSLSQLN
ncbi:MAG: hypothetical protein JSS32_05175 [Verrucomicrobia bacterium]|nr:hypothetical protein [Verrucomicrobiota bacterium]